MKLTDTKILLSNYPNIRQEVPFGQVGGNETIDIQCGYDIKVDSHQVTLQIASDLITAILAYDHVYIEGNHIWECASGVRFNLHRRTVEKQYSSFYT